MKPNELKLLRTQLAWTQKNMASELRVDSNTVARWERGEAQIPPSIARLAQLLLDRQTGAKSVARHVAGKDDLRDMIHAGLEKCSDPNLFERCACDFLRNNYPNISPIPGGSDGGFDGVVYDEAGFKIPLIATTEKDPHRNLKRSLTRISRSGARITTVIFACSRHLTPRTRERLEATADELGAQQLRIYDQTWFADRLYEDDRWRKDLLGLSGRPSALSKVPLSRTGLPGTTVIGRDKELRRLRNISTDIVLVGDSGLGKTHLLKVIANEGLGLFLVDNDREAIANALRRLKPATIFVDDAHSAHERLRTLIQIRDELGADFRILAATWTHAAKEVCAILRTPASARIDLELIDADTMVKIVRGLGFRGQNEWVRVMVHQASGRPGLAATLVHLMETRKESDVWSGKALLDHVAAQIAPDQRQIALRILACFGIFGDAGTDSLFVAQHLDIPQLYVDVLLSNLGHIGIIRQSRHPKHVFIAPQQFRWILVKELFFCAPHALDYRPILARDPTNPEILKTLVGARSRQANIPELQQLIGATNVADVWGTFASLGRRESAYLIDNRPKLVPETAFALLRHCPDLAIPALLDAVADGQDSSNGIWESNSPYKELGKWIKSQDQSLQQRLQSCRTLLTAARHWWQSRGTDDADAGNVALAAICIAFSPNVEGTETDPGAGHTLTIVSGTLGLNACKEVVALWNANSKLLEFGVHNAWQAIVSLAFEWVTPPMGFRLPGENKDLHYDTAKSILVAAASASKGILGAQRRIAEAAQSLGLEVEVALDPEMSLLYPLARRSGDTQKKLVEHEAVVRARAQDWVKLGPDEAARRIVYYDNEARLANLTWPRFSVSLFQEICARVTDHLAWARALVHRDAPVDILLVFARQVAASSTATFVQWLEDTLKLSKYEPAVVEAVLSNANYDHPLLPTVISTARRHCGQVEVMCLRQEVTTEILRMLLTSNDQEVALAAAVGEWHAANNRPVRWLEDWQSAIVASAELREFRSMDEYHLTEILSKHPNLAKRWLVRIIEKNSEYLPYPTSKIAKDTIRKLDVPARVDLLSALRGSSSLEELIPAIVGDDSEVYEAVLRRNDLRDVRLVPLARMPGRAWRDFVELALNNTASVDDVIEASEPRSWSSWGPQSNYWKERQEAFEQFVADSDPLVSQVARRCAEEMKKRVEECLARERHEAIYGD